jgi:hypothetical protein
LVPTLSAAVSLVAAPSGAVSGVDVAIGILGIGVCGSTLCGVLWLTARTTRFRARAVHSNAAREFGDAARRFSLREASVHGLRHWMMYQLSERWLWIDRGEPLFVDRWGELFDGYVRGRHWFIGIEVAASVATAVLAGLAVAEDASCGTLQPLSVVVDIGFLALILALHPHSAPHDRALAVANAAVTACSSLLGVLDIDTSALTAAQAVLNLVGLVAMLLALAAEGRAAAFVERVLAIMRAVGRRLPLRRRRGRSSRSATVVSQPDPLLYDLPGLFLAMHQLIHANRQRPLHQAAGKPAPSAEETREMLRKMVRVICTDIALQRQAAAENAQMGRNRR